MANQEVIYRLRQGVEVWNTWREQHPTEVNFDLSEADFNHSDLSEANFRYADFYEADLSFSDLSGSDLIVANFRNANLRNADLRIAELIESVLIGANLTEANLGAANLEGANLSEANLANAYLVEANLTGANLSGANLEGANFDEAKLYGANFTNAYMWGTSLGDHDLRVVKGLETVQHDGPSPLSITSFYLSQGNIPASFLRGTGVPNEILEYMKPFTNTPVEYHTCFISYSHHDEAFAKQLDADLRSHNVRCWFAPHDMRIGDEIRSRIDESIRVHDKLLLILSRHSIESTWVKKEVETAFEKEQRQGKLVLFPVKLDDSIMQTEQAWAADIRRMRHIGDFQHWKDHDEYMQAFERLLRNLKADDTIKP